MSEHDRELKKEVFRALQGGLTHFHHLMRDQTFQIRGGTESQAMEQVVDKVVEELKKLPIKDTEATLLKAISKCAENGGSNSSMDLSHEALQFSQALVNVRNIK